MGYSNRKPYYGLDKGYLDYSRTTNRYLKESIEKESQFEKPYLDGEYSKMQLNWPKPSWPSLGPGGPVGAFGKIPRTLWMRYIFPPPSCGLASESTTAWFFHWWNSCGDVTVISFNANSFFKADWFWTFSLYSNDLNIEDISREITSKDISLWTDVPGTVGIVTVCGKGTSVQPLTRELSRSFKEGEPSGFWHGVTQGLPFTLGTTQKGFVYCCEEVEFSCPEDECVDDPAMTYDYVESAATIEQGHSVTVAVTGLNTPFEWSVSGAGFTLENATTTGLTNTLIADANACGSATITVTGCDGTLVTGYVRCTTGVWNEESNTSISDTPHCNSSGECPYQQYSWTCGVVSSRIEYGNIQKDSYKTQYCFGCRCYATDGIHYGTGVDGCDEDLADPTNECETCENCVYYPCPLNITLCTTVIIRKWECA